MKAEMVRRAEKVKAAAEADAPVYTGRYKDSFKIESGIRDEPTRRAYARVENDSPEAVYVEFGTKNNEAHHTLQRALEAAGD